MFKLRGSASPFRFRPRAVSETQQDVDADRDRRWAAWIKRIAEGDLEALSTLYDESSNVIFSLVSAILPNRQAAEDALVEIYDVVRRQAPRFDSRRLPPLDWLITLARNLAADRARQVKAAAPGSSHPAQDLFKHKRQMANLAWARLSEEQRSILEMTYLGGLTAAEVADVLDLPFEYVTQQIAAAMRRLQTAGQNPSPMTIRISNL